MRRRRKQHGDPGDEIRSGTDTHTTNAQAEAPRHEVRRDTPEQVSRLEDIYQAAGPAMRTQKTSLDRLQKDLSAMVNDGRADDVAAADLIARVENARADLGRSRALMLYRMRRLLTSDQHMKLKVLFDEHSRESRSHPKKSPNE